MSKSVAFSSLTHSSPRRPPPSRGRREEVGLKRGLFFVEKPQQSRRVKVVVKVVLWFVAESKTKTREVPPSPERHTWIFFFLFFHIETKTLNPKRTSLCLCFLLHHEDKILERERGRAFDTFFSPSLLKALFLYTSSFLRHTTHWTFLSMLRCVFLFSDDDDDDDDEKCNENTTNNHRDYRSFSFSFSSFSARAFLRRIKIVIIIIKYLTLFFSKSIL